MRKILAASIFVLAFCVFAFGQDSSCPEIKVTGPSSVVQPGETMTFTVNLSDIDLSKIEYQWSVDRGTVIEGQGTPVITVSTEGLTDTTITATVKIKGLQNNCNDSVSETTGVVSVGCGLPLIFDDFGKISKSDEKTRLLALGSDLQNNVENNALIILYHTPKDNKKTLSVRIKRIKNLLVSDMKISKERIIIVFGGEESEERTRIYLSPLGILKPEDFDTKKSIEEVEFSKTENK